LRFDEGFLANGDFDPRDARSDPAPVAGPLGFYGRAGRVGLSRKTLLSRAADRPQIACGVQSGDVSTVSAVVWARADRPSRMLVECSTVESFKSIFRTASTMRCRVAISPPRSCSTACRQGRTFFIACGLTTLPKAESRARPKSGISAPLHEQKSVSFVWSAIRRAGLGHRSLARRHANLPHHAGKSPGLLIHSGDHIYADCTVPSELKLPDGTIWRNYRH